MFVFFFHDPAPTEIYTLSLHDALPISSSSPATADETPADRRGRRKQLQLGRSGVGRDGGPSPGGARRRAAVRRAGRGDGGRRARRTAGGRADRGHAAGRGSERSQPVYRRAAGDRDGGA